MRKLLIILSFSILACGQMATFTPSPVASIVPFPLPIITATTQGCVWVVTAEKLNLRTGPSTSYPGTLVLVKGERVYDPQDMGNGWINVDVWRNGDKTAGYVNSDFIAKECG